MGPMLSGVADVVNGHTRLTLKPMQLLSVKPIPIVYGYILI